MQRKFVFWHFSSTFFDDKYKFLNEERYLISIVSGFPYEIRADMGLSQHRPLLRCHHPIFSLVCVQVALLLNQLQGFVWEICKRWPRNWALLLYEKLRRTFGFLSLAWPSLITLAIWEWTSRGKLSLSFSLCPSLCAFR